MKKTWFRNNYYRIDKVSIRQLIFLVNVSIHTSEVKMLICNIPTYFLSPIWVISKEQRKQKECEIHDNIILRLNEYLNKRTEDRNEMKIYLLYVNWQILTDMIMWTKWSRLYENCVCFLEQKSWENNCINLLQVNLSYVFVQSTCLLLEILS